MVTAVGSAGFSVQQTQVTFQVFEIPQGLTETLRLFDHQDVIMVETTGAGDDVALVLVGDMITRTPAEGGVDWYASTEKDGHVTDFIAIGRSILTSFAKFEELEPASKFYGRLPNIVKPGSIDYHTTDRTPRWVIAVREYVRYSGDRSIVSEPAEDLTGNTSTHVEVRVPLRTRCQ